ncbi:MerR family transcriptional regulator [Nocardioides sp. Soil796]|uniref:MerR family transcriptional regulator n=1 Tax=Nocardioides sp. Soil796 TaxID=1736412 RepID=UPI00070DAC99|nr:MerR family transcriptional regulator [Nocardioides sp. Soil796]KRF15763.1 hypothetical protein ASH02_03740 [Nocardioides sp. Soil796]
MRISKLSERAGLPVGTVKFYLRSGLLHAGRATSATQALYDETHLKRLRLIRALLEVGRLSLSDIHEILDAMDLPDVDTESRVTLVRAAIAASSGVSDSIDVTAAQDLLADLGWHVAATSPHLPALARALWAAESVGLEIDPDHFSAYAEAAALAAHSDRTAISETSAENLPTTVAATTVLLDQVLIALHRLAMENDPVDSRGVPRGARHLPGPRQPAASA